MYDIDRKLGIGNEYLNEIKHDTSVLPDVKNGIDTLNIKFDTMIEKFDTMNVKFDTSNEKFDSFTTNFDSYISEQRVFNMRMDEHNHRLEKILEKLTEK